MACLLPYPSLAKPTIVGVNLSAQWECCFHKLMHHIFVIHNYIHWMAVKDNHDYVFVPIHTSPWAFSRSIMEVSSLY